MNIRVWNILLMLIPLNMLLVCCHKENTKLKIQMICAALTNWSFDDDCRTFYVFWNRKRVAIKSKHTHKCISQGVQFKCDQWICEHELFTDLNDIFLRFLFPRPIKCFHYFIHFTIDEVTTINLFDFFILESHLKWRNEIQMEYLMRCPNDLHKAIEVTNGTKWESMLFVFIGKKIQRILRNSEISCGIITFGGAQLSQLLMKTLKYLLLFYL